jgi:hypothetical protein
MILILTNKNTKNILALDLQLFVTKEKQFHNHQPYYTAFPL